MHVCIYNECACMCVCIYIYMYTRHAAMEPLGMLRSDRYTVSPARNLQRPARCAPRRMRSAGRRRGWLKRGPRRTAAGGTEADLKTPCRPCRCFYKLGILDEGVF